jgi:HEAT repeat protein
LRGGVGGGFGGVREEMENEMNSTVKNLIVLLSSRDDLVRTGACKSLIAIGKPAVPFLVEALKDSHYMVRWEAAKALGAIGDPTAAPALVQALEDDAFEVRWRAAEGLTKMGVNGISPLLKALVEDAESFILRDSAHHILHRVARGELRDYLLPVLTALESIWPSVEVSTAALRVVERLEEFQKTRGETDRITTKEPVSAITNQPTDLGARWRAQRYAKTLREQALCGEDLRPGKMLRPDERSVLCTMYD